jgi:hypothetical protein
MVRFSTHHDWSHFCGNVFKYIVVVQEVSFGVKISTTIEDCPSGYLFLCPAKDLRTATTSFKWPDCPAYWSLDPAGIERLSTNEATGLGFPSFQLITDVRGWSWDASVYAGLCQFYRGKGFDPDSQDVARHLGQPLYQLSSEIDVPIAHSEPKIP